MTKATLKLIAEPQAEAEPNKGEASHYIPLKRLSSDVLIKSYCDDCNTERTMSATDALLAGVSPFATVDTLNRTEKCPRHGCGGDLRFMICKD
jgi:hypothetical protein